SRTEDNSCFTNAARPPAAIRKAGAATRGDTVNEIGTSPPPSETEPDTGFHRFGLCAEVLTALADMGYREPTEVQVQTLPLAMAGRDLIVQSRTGTGKTAAFGIRIVNAVDPAAPVVQALVLTPARELTLQVAGELSRIAAVRRVRCLPIYG